MRNLLFVISTMLSITSASAQVSVNIGLPGVSIGISQPSYPDLVPVPGYPVYYDPQADSNYFFYDGMYWVYQQDNWYASTWYNGPWGLVTPEEVPLFILRVPVSYYRRPPSYFGGWAANAPPRWGDHWGNEWQTRRSGWDNWNHNAVPAPAPLPTYQRQYSGTRYPVAAQQQVLQTQNYKYQPKDAVVQQRYQAQRAQSPPAAAAKQDQRAVSGPTPVQQGAAGAQHGQSQPATATVDAQKAAAAQQHAQQPPQKAIQPQAQQAQKDTIQTKARAPQKDAAPPQKDANQTKARAPQKEVAQPPVNQTKARPPQKEVAQPQKETVQTKAPQKEMAQPQQSAPKREQEPTKQAPEKDEKQGGNK
jgi:hypothetical protein